MIQVTERARETPGLGVFPDTWKDDDRVIEHDGRAVLLIDHEISETLADTTIDVEEHADGAHFVVRRTPDSNITPTKHHTHHMRVDI